MDELQYILHNGRPLMTPEEQAATTLVLLRKKRLVQKTRVGSSFVADQVRLAGELGKLSPAELNEHLLRRFRRDHSDTGFFVRCPTCRGLLRTPRARQCACGADWHDTSEGSG